MADASLTASATSETAAAGAPAGTGPAPASEGVRRRPWVALVLGILMNGLGQVYVGQWPLGVGIAIAFPVAVGVGTAAALRAGAPLLWCYIAIIVVLLVAHVALAVAAAVRADGLTLPRTAGLRRVGPYLLFVAAAMATSALDDTTPFSRSAVEAFKIPAGSMIPALEIGDQVLVGKVGPRARAPAPGEVIVFTVPIPPYEPYVKRVAAVSGDEVEVRRGILYVNRTPVDDPGGPVVTAWDRDGPSGPWHRFEAESYAESLGGRRYRVLHERGAPQVASDYGPFTVPDGNVFVLGDNRDRSFDSRCWGPVPLENVIGYVDVIWWSWGKDGFNWRRIGRSVE